MLQKQNVDIRTQEGRPRRRQYPHPHCQWVNRLVGVIIARDVLDNATQFLLNKTPQGEIVLHQPGEIQRGGRTSTPFCLEFFKKKPAKLA